MSQNVRLVSVCWTELPQLFLLCSVCPSVTVSRELHENIPKRPIVGYSQLQDEHHISSVLVDVVQRDDVWVLDLLQDVHLPLYLLPPHSSRAGHALTLLDELGSKFQTCTFLSALLYDGKLPAETQRGKENALSEV